MTHTPPHSTPLLQGRALAFAAILLAAFNLRTAVTSITPLLDHLGHTFGFGTTFTGVLGMLPSAAFALFGMATPMLARRFGLERTALLAMGLAAAGLVLRSCSAGVLSLLFGSIVALAGMGIGNVVVPPLVKRYFANRVGTVSTLYITVLQLGTMLPALLAVPLAEQAGWRVSLGIWSLLAVAAALPWLMLARRRPHPDPLEPAVDANAAPHGKVWRTPLAWGMTLMFGMTSLMTYSMFTWLPRIVVEAGASHAFGGLMVAVFAALGVLPSLTMPALAVRLRNPFPLVLIGVGAFVIAFAGLLFAPMMAPWLWVGLLGVGPSTFPLALTLINLRTRTPAGSAALSGFMQGVGYSFSCLGPFLFGWLHEMSGAWYLPFGFLAVCLVVLLAASWVACKPQKLEDQW